MTSERRGERVGEGDRVALDGEIDVVSPILAQQDVADGAADHEDVRRVRVPRGDDLGDRRRRGLAVRASAMLSVTGCIVPSRQNDPRPREADLHDRPSLIFASGICTRRSCSAETIQTCAIASISTSAPLGSPEICTVERAGGRSPTWRA